MSMKSPIVGRPSSGRRWLASMIVAAVCSAIPAGAQDAQDKTAGERIKEEWQKLIAKAESGAKSAGDEYHKLRDQAARASGPAREKMADEMEALGKKWAAAREKLVASTERHMNALGAEYKTLEEKAGKASGSAREKMATQMEKLHDEWLAARAKMEATLSANLKSSREEIEHLKEHAAASAEEAKAKLEPRMERLKTEFHKNRDKLAAYLESDLKQTKEDMEKLGKTTSDAARSAKEKLSKKYHELETKIEELSKEKASDEPK
jgi:uncharacterized protein YicC (UPF0701 family)